MAQERGMGRKDAPGNTSLQTIGDTHFLGIGINAYVHWPALHNAVHDIEAIAQLLTDTYGISSTTLLLDKAATRKNILAELERLANTLKAPDSLIIYYAGHGHLNNRKRGFWVPVDATKQGIDQFVANSTIRDYIGDIPSLHTLLISDACFSGSLFVRGERGGHLPLQELATLASRWAICSGRHDEVVADGSKGKHSPFAQSILDVLSKSTKEAITANFLYEQVRLQTRANYTQLPDGGPLQHVGHKRGEYVFVKKQDEQTLWQKTQASGSLAAYQHYLDCFPEGTYVEKASQQINQLQAADAWERIQHLPDDTLPEINAKSFRIFDFCQQFQSSAHYQEAVALGKQLDAKKEFTSSYHSLFGLMEISNKPGPFREAARERLATLRKEQQEQNTPAAAAKARPKAAAAVTPRKTKQSFTPPDVGEKKAKPITKKGQGKTVVWLKRAAIVLPILLLVIWGLNKYNIAQKEKARANAQLDRIEEALQDALTRVDTTAVLEMSASLKKHLPKIRAQKKVYFIAEWLGNVRDSLAQVAIGSDLPIEEAKPQPAVTTVEEDEKIQTKRVFTPPTTVREEKQPQTRPASKTATIADIAANMVRVAGGTFTMGCQDGRDTDCYDREKPAHTVGLNSFYISKYEVTQAQWRAVMGSDPPDLYNKGCDQCPVESVSWNDIQEFLQKLNSQTEKNYRLPTEAEWEYAARGGNKSQGYLYSGSNTIGEVAWYSANAREGNTHGAEKTSRPVGGKKPNELGLYDMSGNVYERCSDRYGEDYYKISQQNPRGPDSGTNRVDRGGSWDNSSWFCRAAYRAINKPTLRSNYFGFRLAARP